MRVGAAQRRQAAEGRGRHRKLRQKLGWERVMEAASLEAAFESRVRLRSSGVFEGRKPGAGLEPGGQSSALSYCQRSMNGLSEPIWTESLLANPEGSESGNPKEKSSRKLK